jgi:hypothetical protein
VVDEDRDGEREEGRATAHDFGGMTGPARTRLQRIRERVDGPRWRACWQRTADGEPSEAGDTVDATEDLTLLLQLAEAAARDDDEGVFGALAALEETLDEE